MIVWSRTRASPLASPRLVTIISSFTSPPGPISTASPHSTPDSMAAGRAAGFGGASGRPPAHASRLIAAAALRLTATHHRVRSALEVLLTDLLVPTYRQSLRALAAWLRKAEAAGTSDALMAARLAPDMFPLSTQVRFVCLQAYEGVQRLRFEALPTVANALLEEGRAAGEHPGTISEAYGAHR